MMVIWLTGLSGSGKSTLSSAVYGLLMPHCPQVVALDGDAVRAAFGNDLGYTEEDRVVQVKRLQRMASLLSDQGLIVIVSAVYSNPGLLAWNRKSLNPYFEIYVKSSLETVMARDSKGLYRAVTNGETANVVGVDIPWISPATPDLVVDADNPVDPAEIARRVIEAIPQLATALRGV